MTRRLMVHIGAPKTGTTFLQAVLRANTETLRGYGFALAAEKQRDVFAATNDLVGDSGTPLTKELRDEGAWDAMATRLRSSDAPTVIYSDERLASLTRRRIARVAALGTDREIHVVYATRELGTLMPSAWQEHVKHGSDESMIEWGERILRSDPSVASRFFFWHVHDVVRVLTRWSEAVATPERVHVIPVPRQSGGSEELWTRFAVAIGLAPELDVTTAVSRSNPALDHAQVEFLRRVNEELGDALSRPAHMRWMRDVLSKDAMGGLGHGQKARLPEHLTPDVEARAAAVIEYLASSEYDIIGDLDDLIPSASSPGKDPTQDQVLDAAVTAMAALLESLDKKFGSRKRPLKGFLAAGQETLSAVRQGKPGTGPAR